MSSESPLSVRRRTALMLALALLAAGAAGALLFARVTGRTPAARGDSAMSERTHTAARRTPAGEAADSHTAGPGPTATHESAGQPSPREVVFSISPEAANRAGMRAEPVAAAAATDTVRMPGVIEPYAYRQVEITALTPGRVTRVAVELGQSVRKGQTLAEVFSPELADAQTRYVGARAELGAHERELQRTQKLVEIGAASKQDLERIHAEHTAQKTVVQTARSRLALLGMSEAAIAALVPGERVNPSIRITSPLAGVITERQANAGRNIDAGTKLFTVVDMTNVWVMGDVYERDVARVQIGDRATVTTAAYPDVALSGRVSYIDPQLNVETRTARVRVEVPNGGRSLKLGMYAAILLVGTGGRDVPLVPADAIQNVGTREVVYVVDPQDRGRLTERAVRVGARSGDRVEVLEGLRPGELIVTEGSFFARAERERLGLAAGNNPSGEPRTTARITASRNGFEPARIRVKAGVPVRLTFVRTTDETCATEVVFPSLKIRRSLPRDKPVLIEFTPKKSGEIAFACGMNMFTGAVVVE
jgi:membrane fusion protein, heavy metal efflux system